MVAELDRLRPSAVLIEGPADADPLLALAADPGMVPPVALLAYAPDEPRVSAFWPFAVFSPEWQALSWAAANAVPVRFCDLPAGMVLAGQRRERRPAGDHLTQRAGPGNEDRPRRRRAEPDPIGQLAAAAGYDDPERWWEDVIERRGEREGRPDSALFAALGEAMAELRAGRAGSALEQRREAHMRQVLRAALKETTGTVAVVCGAWHVPALTAPLPPASKDAALLRGVPKRKAALAWVPWTHSRLASASGYGAGITSPGWYQHLFSVPDQTIARWLTRVAGVLRGHDLPVSSAHIIEAVRLAETLAVMRGRPLAGLAEVSEAAKSVMCDGDDLAAAFVTRDLVVGEALGAVPDGAPPVPLDADLRARARALKLKIEPLTRTLALDLRKETDRGRSVLLHRLGVLGIGWGRGHGGPGPRYRYLPRDVDPALAPRTGGRDHRRRRLGHHGGVRRDREDRVRRVAGRSAGGRHQGGRAGAAGRPVGGARTGAARPRRLGRDRVRRHPPDGRRPRPGARDPVRRRSRHRHRRRSRPWWTR